MVTLGIAGYSGSGKTTLVINLIPALKARGIEVSTIKHTHHNVALDRKGDASRRLSAAGAGQVLVAGRHRWALLQELRGAPEPNVKALSQRMSAVDLILVEGFKRQGHEKIEVHRPDIGKPLLYPDDKQVIAVASDRPISGSPLPNLDLNDPEAIADFIVRRYGFSQP